MRPAREGPDQYEYRTPDIEESHRGLFDRHETSTLDYSVLPDGIRMDKFPGAVERASSSKHGCLLQQDVPGIAKRSTWRHFEAGREGCASAPPSPAPGEGLPHPTHWVIPPGPPGRMGRGRTQRRTNHKARHPGSWRTPQHKSLPACSRRWEIRNWTDH